MRVAEDTEFWTTRVRKRCCAAVLKWGAVHGREHLPWRLTNDPYRVWLSEIMLQQTTVAAVVPYFDRFLAAFPTVRDLANADEGDVLRLWEGLGYYSRARNLHAAAKIIAAEHGGKFPRELAALNDLPGVGRYTAGAVASFAFDLPAPILEANTLRLYARLIGLEEDPRSTSGQRRLWAFADSLVETARGAGQSVRALNLGLMDLGAKVCTPTSPNCPECPLASMCIARLQGRQQELPKLAARAKPTDQTDLTIALAKEGRYLLRRRPTGERWAGLWDFPRYTWSGETSLVDLLTSAVRQQSGLTVHVEQEIAEFRHSVTRYRIRLRCFLGSVISGRLSTTSEWQWVEPERFEAYALSVTGRKLARRLTAEPPVVTQPSLFSE